MIEADRAAFKSALGAVAVPPGGTPLKDVVAAWWTSVGSDGSDLSIDAHIGAALMADRVLDELVTVVLRMVETGAAGSNGSHRNGTTPAS